MLRVTVRAAADIYTYSSFNWLAESQRLQRTWELS